MNFLEKNLEDIIFDTPNEKLQERGLDIYGIKKRQVSIGSYGICDMITIFRIKNAFFVRVYELKKDFINVDTLLQAVKYKRGIVRYFEKHLKEKGWSINIDIVLIGRKIDTEGSFCFLADYAGFDFYTYDYDFDGISFNYEMGYKHISEGF